ncbi:MAG: ABC transporter ATP-binding protein [Gemmiger sp.]|uniref:ABC transporter ATP-binding protein n=1 Tax=Gemmiger sp. TaxID=2049027 RepID=UPI002A811693|nr:ABC transporter ATP-binding protein [Gemmiger sp.]MDY4879252.1 ABC transporter ATP-binding protein [Gemmiger sp.]
MKLIFRYMGRYRAAVLLAMGIKLAGTMTELLLPYILEYMIDDVVPAGSLPRVVLWGLLMFAAAVVCRQLNVLANRRTVDNAHRISYDVRQDLFVKTANLPGSAFDELGLPSLISRMTSDSYNVQSAVQQLQSMCVRAPMLLLGGMVMTLAMDLPLAMILVVMLPVLLAVVFFVCAKGIPMYNTVQKRLDSVVRIMRENITGIRVVKALSKADYEKRRFAAANREMTNCDIKASTVMAIPGPLMQLCLNVGLTLVVVAGAWRVNEGLTRPGVILAFLTYFNMITMGVMGLSRIFMTLSKASASAGRIAEVLAAPDEQRVLRPGEALQPSGAGFLRFENVDFSYGKTGAGFAGGEREKALDHISFSLNRGESLGIIGPTGCGKTTIINLLMRFYDADAGGVFVDGRDVRSYDKDELHRKFGVAFQNDMVFQDTLGENIRFGRDLDEAALRRAAKDAMAAEYIDSLEDGLDHPAAIKGANLSGGQKQRLLVARALAGNPEILVLDDSSSALDYKTDAAMRRAIARSHGDSTVILIAQRVSSVMGMDHILVMDNGRCIGYGSHRELLENCPPYREIYETQMGAME